MPVCGTLPGLCRVMVCRVPLFACWRLGLLALGVGIPGFWLGIFQGSGGFGVVDFGFVRLVGQLQAGPCKFLRHAFEVVGQNGVWLPEGFVAESVSDGFGRWEALSGGQFGQGVVEDFEGGGADVAVVGAEGGGGGGDSGGLGIAPEDVVRIMEVFLHCFAKSIGKGTLGKGQSECLLGESRQCGVKRKVFFWVCFNWGHGVFPVAGGGDDIHELFTW